MIELKFEFSCKSQQFKEENVEKRLVLVPNDKQLKTDFSEGSKKRLFCFVSLDLKSQEIVNQMEVPVMAEFQGNPALKTPVQVYALAKLSSHLKCFAAGAVRSAANAALVSRAGTDGDIFLPLFPDGSLAPDLPGSSLTRVAYNVSVSENIILPIVRESLEYVRIHIAVQLVFK